MIGLEPRANVLEKVIITGVARKDVEIGDGVNAFSLEGDALALSGSTLDAMKGLPGVTLDREGKVLLRGSDKVVVLINGKQSGLTGVDGQASLDSIPAANISRIEIINNPSSKYGSAGSAGVINLIMKDDAQKGWSGDFSFKYGVGVLEKTRADLPTDLGSYSQTPKYSPSFSVTYGNDYADYFMQGEVLVQEKLPNNEFTTRYYDDGRIIASQVPENREQTHWIIKLGTDQHLTSNDTLSISGLYDVEDHTDRAQVPFINVLSGERERYWYWTEKEQTGAASIAVDYKHAFGESGRELTSRIEYIRGWEDESYYLNEESSVRIGDDATHIEAVENSVPISVDYVHPVSNGRIEAGAKFQFRWIPITYDVTRGTNSVIYTGLGDTSDWSENIYAGYVNYVREGKHTVIEGGIRAEQTEVTYDISQENIYYPGNDAYDYFKVFPNVRLTWKLDSDASISAFYNARVDRPGEPELRIFPKYDDPELLKVGNPYLRPQYSKTFELAAKKGFDGYSVSAAIYQKTIEDYFQRIYAVDETNPNYDIVNKIYANTGKSTHNGIELIATAKPASWISISSSINAYRIKNDQSNVALLFPYPRDIELAASEGDTWDGKFNLDLKLPFDLEMRVTGVYYADRAIPQGHQKARSSLDFGLTKTLFDGSAELAFAVMDIFTDFGLDQSIDGVGFHADYFNGYETQTASLTLKFNIG